MSGVRRSLEGCWAIRGEVYGILIHRLLETSSLAPLGSAFMKYTIQYTGLPDFAESDFLVIPNNM